MPTEDSQQAIAETPSESAYQPPVIKQYILANRYEIYREVGDGSFGTVSLARRRESRASSGSGNSRNPQLVAVKSMKKPITPMTECLKLRELQSLTALPPHPAIVTLNEFFYDAETKLFHMVMEFLDQNLYQLMKSREGKPFDLLTVKQILLAILEALDHCHSHNYFHRDVKPENILISYRSATDLSNASTSSQCLGTPTASKSYLGTPPTTPARMIVKLADFGLARQIDSRPPYTSYVSTRWYRAPEVLLRAEKYSAPVDMWALGSMAVEVATLKPLFPGKDEMDQVWKICEVLGSPGDWRDRQGRPTGGGPWDDGPLLAHKLGLTFPKTPPQPTTRLLNASWPDNFVEFCLSCMTWDPNVRLTSASAIRLPMFADVIRPQSNVISTPTTSSGKADTSQLSKSTQRHSWLSKTRNVVMATTLQKQARQPHASQSITVPATVNTNDPSDSPSQNTRSRKKEQRASLVLPDHERHSQAAKTKEPTTYASAAAASSTTGTTGEDLVVPTPRKLRKTSKHTGPGPDDVDAISPGSLASSSHATNPSLTSLDEAMHLLDVPAIPITISTDPMDVVLGGTCGGGGGGGSIGVPSIHTSTSTPTRDAKPLRNPTATVTTPRGPIPLPGYARSTIASSRRASSNISPDLETIQSPQQQQQPLPQHHQPTPAKKQGRLSALFGSSFTR
ncbi:Serine/threonine protein kinase [Savitreella phatthalungensis]